MNIKFVCCCGKQQSGRIVVVAAGTGGSKAIPYDKKKKAGKKHEEGRRKQQKRSTTDKKQQQNIMNTSMAKVKADETVLFDAVPGVSDALSVIYAYPNEYSVGITSLGYQLVWAYLEMSELVSVSRMFTDVSDGVAFKQRGVDLVGFSLSWELDYTNIVSMLQGLEIPVFSNERSKQCPIVFGGGPVLTANPEPFAAFFDVILLGDGEEMLETLVTTVYKVTRDGTGGSHDNRQEVLEALARLPGMYVPQFYEPVYDGGKLVGMDVHAAAPPFVEKQTYRGNALASSTVVSPRMAWDNIFMAEVVRSCPEMCRFCMASYLTLPFRPAELEGSLIPTIERGLEVTDRIGLLGASVTQHPEFDKLLDWMMKPEREHVRMSIASVRTNTVTPELASALSARGTNSLTIAVESGSERVRRIVNKKLDQEDIQKAAVNAQAGGLKSLKLYGMVGVPGESDQGLCVFVFFVFCSAKIYSYSNYNVYKKTKCRCRKDNRNDAGSSTSCSKTQVNIGMQYLCPQSAYTFPVGRN
jgi:radical SAM superfamily enzyme YgiQ (UPF0313 family)